jgi:hypothetical protein
MHAHFVLSGLNYRWASGGSDVDDPQWLRHRVKVYLRYTVGSLLRQTVRDFTIWLDCREDSQPQLEPYLPALCEAGVRATFDRGRRMLAELPAACRSVYVTRIDSDDMYGPDAIQRVRELHGQQRASQFYRGYMHCLETGETSRVRLRSPPFYTIRFDRGEIESAECFERAVQPIGERRGHVVVRERLSPVPLPDARFCVLRHGRNTGGPLPGELIEAPYARREVRERFDLEGRFWQSWGGPRVRELLEIRQQPVEGDVAVLLTSWRRPQNLRRQLEAVAAQTVSPREIAIWHNGPEAFDAAAIPPGLPATVVSSSRNAGVWPRFLFAMEFESPFVCVFDDDAIPGRRWLENCLRSMAVKEGLYGANGVIFPDVTRSKRRNVGWMRPNLLAVECDIVGHSWFFKRDWLRYYALEPRRGEFDHGEDYHFSVALQKHLGLGTYVPPHPPDDKQWWGSTAERLGRDRAASSRRPGAAALKQAAHDAYLASGWEPMALRAAELTGLCRQ